MQDVAICEECGVPEPFYQANTWLNNGDMVQSANHQVRLSFIECKMLDPLFKNIGDIIGMPIERLVTNIAYRGFKLYMDQVIPENVQEMLRDKTLDMQPFADSMLTLCHTSGFGKYEMLDYRRENDENDYSRLRVLKPFSVPEVAGAYAAAVSTIAGGEHSITYVEISPGLHEFTSRWTKYPEVFKEKMQLSKYNHKDADLEMERCSTCGSPKAFQNYRWYLEDGLIINEDTGARMAMPGSALIDLLFDTLASELGEAIPDVIVEAQRRIMKSGHFLIAELGNVDDFRNQLALRGLGNLQEIKVSPRGVQMRINNASGYYLTVGLVQSLFELSYDKEAAVKWELSKEGDLQLEVVPLFKQFSASIAT